MQVRERIEREQMESYGLKGAYAQYLVALQHHPEGLTAAALSEICDKDKAAVSRAMAELEKKCFLTRGDEGSSAYRAQLRLTAEGMAAADFVCQKAEAAVELAGSPLDDKERMALYEALNKVAASLKKIDINSLSDK